MKQNKSRDFGKSGIYCIRNTVNGKVYIGKAKCIYKRIKEHITRLNTKSKDENPYLINAWHKYGRENFEYFVIEYLELNEELISRREEKWIKHFNSLDKNIGYNLRLDTTTGIIVKKETRLKLSQSRRLRENKFPELAEKVGIKLKEFWKNNPDIKKEMAQKVKKSKEKYRFFKLDEEENILESFETLEELLFKNPNYKWQNIYSVCNGYKKRIYGYKWKKELKI